MKIVEKRKLADLVFFAYFHLKLCKIVELNNVSKVASLKVGVVPVSPLTLKSVNEQRGKILV